MKIYRKFRFETLDFKTLLRTQLFFKISEDVSHSLQWNWHNWKIEMWSWFWHLCWPGQQRHALISRQWWSSPLDFQTFGKSFLQPNEADGFKKLKFFCKLRICSNPNWASRPELHKPPTLELTDFFPRTIYPRLQKLKFKCITVIRFIRNSNVHDPHTTTGTGQELFLDKISMSGPYAASFEMENSLSNLWISLFCIRSELHLRSAFRHRLIGKAGHSESSFNLFFREYCLLRFVSLLKE